MIKSLFISKNLIDVPELALFCSERSIELNAQSLIQFQAIPFQIVNSSDCVFFSSPRSAEFFLSSIQLRKEQLIAVAGDATKRQVESYGYKVSFIPKNSGLVTQSSLEFSEWLGTKTVLFPVSSISNKSYAQNLDGNNVSIIEVYKTKLVSKEICECDLYVFTSPSNAEAFFEKNEIPPASKVITWGESTSKSLLNLHGIESFILSDSYVETLIKNLNNI